MAESAGDAGEKSAPAPASAAAPAARAVSPPPAPVRAAKATSTGQKANISADAVKAAAGKAWALAATFADAQPTVVKVAQQLSLPPAALPLIAVGTALLLVVAMFGASTIVSTCGFWYPLYASVAALHSPDKQDDRYWLSYWLVFSFLTFLESSARWTLSWIPLYWLVKAVFVAYIMLFGGATVVFDAAFKPAATALAGALRAGVKGTGAPRAGAGTGAGAGAAAAASTTGAARENDKAQPANSSKFVLRT